MCFSNLPIEFDEQGNPTLADDADSVDEFAACGCDETVALETDDPEAAVEAVLSTVPESVREAVEGTDETPPVADSDTASSMKPDDGPVVAHGDDRPGGE